MESIEGQELLLISQQITPKFAPPRIAKTLFGTHIMVYPITLQRNGIGEISIEFLPKRCFYCPTSKLSLGDAISGKSLWGYSSKPLKANSVSIGGIAKSHTHPRQHVNISGDCFLQTVEDLLGTSILQHPREIYLVDKSE